MKFFRNALFCFSATFVAIGAYRFTTNSYEILPPMKRYSSSPSPVRRVIAVNRTSVKGAHCLSGDRELVKVLNDSAADVGIDPNLLLAVMNVESRCNLRAVSSRGAVGLMQVLPSTAKLVGVSNLAHPAENIRAGARYLASLKAQFGSDIGMMLAAYNAGPGAVKKYKGVPPYPETQRYVQAVIKSYSEISRSTRRTPA